MSSSLLVEVSWEVANKVGGIYTVVSGHAQLLSEHYEEYLCVGPLFAGRQNFDFVEEPAPEQVRQCLERLRSRGVNGVFGRWDVSGRPACVLLDASHADFDVDAIKAELFERFGVDSLHAGFGFDEPLRWAWAVGLFLAELRGLREDRFVAHLHEWMSGFAGLFVRARGVDVGTVFTTHATMLGRTLSASTDISLYDDLESLDAWSLACELGVVDKHSMEVACARECDVFTTVSDITALEAESLLGVKPAVVTYNGISSDQFPTMEEASVLHAKSRERIHDFLNYYFFSHYRFDLEDTLIFFTSGRYEFKNKGLDVLTDALGRLNEWMRSEGLSTTVVVFYWIPGDAQGIKTQVLEQRGVFSTMQQFVKDLSPQLVRRILRRSGDLSSLSGDELFDADARKKLSRMASKLRHSGSPPLCTHNLPFEEDDSIVRSFRVHGLENSEDDRVKVIRQPVYLNGSDGLLDLTYAEAVAGTHLGLFPSYYEPWGYTPVEAAGYAVASVTTDLGGFGRFVSSEAADSGGVFVLERMSKSYEEVVGGLFEMMRSYVELDKHGRMQQKLAAKELTERTQWETFIKYYYQAHGEAYEKTA